MACNPNPALRTAASPKSAVPLEPHTVPVRRPGFRVTPTPQPIAMPKQRLVVWTPMRIARALMLAARRSAALVAGSARRVRS